ncbi:hypothetical protein CBS147343_5201 [Aspergillus niger]|nr:hypothetical protein CBS11852_3899 [Aspergillus niger]KAI2990236.1 hypothetical protein CBS147344_2579 [Aspergillus niger]KAI3072866.1 hypothetical protein CBS147343_5201 [Aspergillus niger]
MSTLQPSVNRALVLHPGGTFTHSERRIPTIESDRDVLVRVVATGLCGSDIHYWQHGKLGEYEVTQPLILAHESSGVIVATGGNFQGLKINDRVALEPRNPCNVCPYCRSGRYKLCTYHESLRLVNQSEPDSKGRSSTKATDHESVSEFTYPEGGFAAWTVAIGCWCSMTAGLGLVNSVGVLEAYVSYNMLPSSSPSAIGWIFGIYVFISYFCGVQIGPIFDARGPRELMILGTVCSLAGIFCLGLCTEYYQFILSLSILNGIGSSFLFTPAMGTISHWFNAKRGLASGFAFTGSGLGGVIFPLMLQSLIPRLGWGWSMRLVGFVLLFLCILSVVLCRSRLPPKRGATSSWRDVLPSAAIFRDGTGAMAVTSAGVFLVEWAYFVPITYLPTYYLTRKGLSGRQAIVDSDAAFAYRLLAILNSVSCLGRFFIGYIADRIGRYNTMIVSTLLCLVSVMCLWLPDAMADPPPTLALIIAFVILFGFASGSNISLTPVCVGQLCGTQDYGRYYASAYTLVSFGCLTGIPIAGSLMKATDDSGRKSFWGFILFTGMSYIASFACFLWVRVRIKGWNWKVIW